MVIEKMKKLFLFVVYSLGIIYGLFSLRYIASRFIPSLSHYTSKFAYYFNPVLNKVTFLMHSTSGIFICILGPILFYSVAKNLPIRNKLIYVFCALSAMPMIWPFVFLFEAKSTGMAFYIVLVTLLIWVYSLARGFYMFQFENNVPLAMTYLVYNYCSSIGAFSWRLIRYVVEYLNTGSLYSFSSLTQLGTLPADIDLASYGFLYELSWFIALCLGIGLAKFILWAKIIKVRADDEEILE